MLGCHRSLEPGSLVQGSREAEGAMASVWPIRPAIELQASPLGVLQVESRCKRRDQSFRTARGHRHRHRCGPVRQRLWRGRSGCRKGGGGGAAGNSTNSGGGWKSAKRNGSPLPLTDAARSLWRSWPSSSSAGTAESLPVAGVKQAASSRAICKRCGRLCRRSTARCGDRVDTPVRLCRQNWMRTCHL